MSFLKCRRMSNVCFDRSDLKTENKSIVVIILLFFFYCLHFMYMGKKTLPNLELCLIEKSFEFNKATPAKATEWLKILLISSDEKYWYNYC